MENKSKMGRIVGGLVIGGLLLGGSSLALAANTAANEGNTMGSKAGICAKMACNPRNLNGENMKSVLSSLVASNTITQAQADQIIARQQQLQAERQQKREQMKELTQAEREALREQNKTERVGLLTQLVKEGTITQEQADAIKSAVQEKRTALRQEKITTALNGLVEKKIITADQSTAILNKLAEMQNSRQAEMQKLKDMTAEQRREYMKEHKPINPMAELVSSGVLTQEQADQIQKELGHPNKAKEMQRGLKNGGSPRGQSNLTI